MSSDSASQFSEESPYQRRNPRRLVWVRNIFLTGMAVVMPILATVFLLNAGLQIIDYIADQFFRFLGLTRHIPKYEILGVKVIPLLIMVAVVFAAGVVGAHAIGQRIIQFVDGLVLRVPLVSTIYSAAKQVMETLRTFEGTPNFQYVVYLDYPSPGCRLIGFVTGRFQEPRTKREITTVFLPTSPNPITGYVVAVDSDKLTTCPLTVEEATKLIVSFGLVLPASGFPSQPPTLNLAEPGQS